MLQTLSTAFIRTLREDPADAEVASHKLLVRASYIRRTAPGIYTWLPLGLAVVRKIEAIVREEMNRMGGQEVHFPALLPAEPYKATQRWDEYGPTLFTLQDRKGGDYLLAPTHEEMFTLLAKDMFSSYKDLPATLYQIQTKYRDEARPRAGLIRGREFIMKDSYSFDVDDAGLDASYQRHRDAYERIFRRLGLEYVPVNAMAGAMGGSHSEEFLHPSPIGEDTFVRSDGGYAANAEAVTTPVPPSVDASAEPAPQVVATPDTPTIDSLVDLCNSTYPRPDGREWTAADTLKNVVVVLIHPHGERELLVVGVPGDREVDMKRLEAAVAPAEVEMASEEDFKTHPELVPGYIGPQAIGPNSPLRRTETDEQGREVLTGSVRYLLDPRIVDGTSWVTGANELKKHVLHLVKGRDFEADGTIEAAEVREGDLAPDGSGPLHLERGIEVGHIFALGRKYAQALGFTVLDENGKARVVTMGSYGIGVSRVMAALAEANHDERGLAWPIQVAPYHVQVLATGKDEQVFATAHALARELDAAGLEVLYDDRRKVSAGVKFADSELLGVPFTVVVGRDLAKEGTVEIRDRRSGERRSVPAATAAAEVRATVEAALVAAPTGEAA
ncbi:MAG: proline--tRNA ligase [Actinomyces urogenitalis]|uniref:Proline--tRNA ligase n=2 Tax=Actinomyces urogenitalis TaxID=103621 RepID=C0W7C3_9ACTO|nr:proline--tRNA ligase [Actinomyces urogenitalis]EEH65384.1 proline--tRNA ligase [Actinomyces urogenitalis DSM 15434]KGE98958.1 prolyl-tRNA synthetase [Actinomyces urogenitalis S6-C4]MBS5977111.1 proline--tRNA ligase [Actinomyces urogenitalis]MBS6072440.1 proline--tRNA ligase [Actinomyces urogenitalis]MDK8236923.1 proline--tRNA ligase [Actinomyces urogenitalis]